GVVVEHAVVGEEGDHRARASSSRSGRKRLRRVLRRTRFHGNNGLRPVSNVQTHPPGVSPRVSPFAGEVNEPKGLVSRGTGPKDWAARMMRCLGDVVTIGVHVHPGFGTFAPP